MTSSKCDLACMTTWGCSSLHKQQFFVLQKDTLGQESQGGVHSQEMPGTEVPLGWVAFFDLRYRDGSRFLPFGINMGRNFCHQVWIFKLRYKDRYRFSNSGP